MKKITKTCLSWATALALSLGLLTACGSSGGSTATTAGAATAAGSTTAAAEDSANSTEAGSSAADSTGTTAADTTTATVDTSKKADLVFYLMGDPPQDMDQVQDQINQILEEKYNATVTFKFTTWTDFNAKYNMVLSSGEPCDLIYTANWLDYASLSKSHAFASLDDLLQQYAPDLYSYIPEETWAQMKVDGQIYAVPSTKTEYTNAGIQYREDLRAAYDLPYPDSLENVEAYLKGIKENLPDQSVLKPSVNEGEFGMMAIFQLKYSWVSDSTHYGLAADYNTPSQLYNYWASDDFREDMKLMKSWADAGFWSKSALSDANDSEAFINDQEVMTFGGQNPAKYIGIKNSADLNPDWDVEYIPFATVNGVAYTNHPTGNCTAIPTSSSNKERAMMVLDALYMDKTLNQLIMYGIQGDHYDVDSDGNYVKLDNNDAYTAEAANTWDLRNEEYSIPQETDKQLNEIFDQLNEIAQKTNYPNVDIASGFAEVYDDYASERAALTTVMTQYLAPIEAGLVDDVDSAIDQFLEKAEEAGLSKIQESYTKQWEAYCQEYNYQ